VVRLGKERVSDLYLGLSVLVALSFIKLLLVFGRMPLWIFILSGIPLLLILWNLIQIWRGDYRDAKRLEILCRNTLFVNLSITMILTIQQTIVKSNSFS
jgi:1,4-dihydroxy-2-naphthoate octaprenyltransferase